MCNNRSCSSNSKVHNLQLKYLKRNYRRCIFESLSLIMYCDTLILHKHIFKTIFKIRLTDILKMHKYILYHTTSTPFVPNRSMYVCSWHHLLTIFLFIFTLRVEFYVNLILHYFLIRPKTHNYSMNINVH